MSPGVYRYETYGHQLAKTIDGDKRAGLAVAALGQGYVEHGAINIVFSAVYERTTKRYGERGIRYVHMEAGHAAQNAYLQTVALDLGTVIIGAFHDDQVREALSLPKQEQPLYIMPVEKKKVR
ncbi:SagB/ThcOx family dehydrogenase [Chloroflexota bacterium]